MAIINLMKDIIVNTIEEVLKKEKNINISTPAKDDIIAYVLNRVQPKFVTSERGLLHVVLEAKYKIQERVDILFLIYEAILMVNRRGSNLSATEMANSDSIYLLPHIVGQVLEESTLSVVPEVEITLRHGDSPAAMVDSDWDNPYKINPATKGHYHFWPYYSESSMGKKNPVKFTLYFHNPKFEDNKLDVELEAVLKIERVRTLFIPLVLMSAAGTAGSGHKK